jgi:Mn2+/Fe2+ NRAMP family transporter
MQRNNIKNNPSEYGGGGMAMAGMILGGINLVLTIIIFVIYALLILANMR